MSRHERRRRSGRPLPWPEYSRSARTRLVGPAFPVGIELARRCESSATSPGARAARSRRAGRAPSPRRPPGWRNRGPGGWSHRGSATRTWLRASRVAWQSATPPCRISGSVVVARPRAGWSSNPCSSRFRTSSSSVMSRSHERAFHDRSRCPSKILLIARMPPQITGLRAGCRRLLCLRVIRSVAPL